jgi:hypothetical protein
MDLLNYVISIALIGMIMQFGELWMAIGVGMISIIASRDIKAGTLILFSMGLLYFVNIIGMKEYWLFAVIGLVALGYIIGVDAGGQEQQDPYAGLMGGLGGMG